MIESAHQMVLDIGERQAHGAKQTCGWRHDNAFYVQRVGQARSVHAAVTANSQQIKLRGVPAFFRGHPAQRPVHGGVGDQMDAIRHFGAFLAQLGADVINGRRRLVKINRQVAAYQHIRIQVAQDHVCICDCRLIAALIITHGTRYRPSATRAHMNAAAPINPRDAAAAGTDFSDIDRRCLNRISSTLNQPVTHLRHANFGPRHDRDFTLFDD